ncbi:MAG: VOC family protein [Deltaproteobacteria bacterium]|nr:VOC family protein [Deltaproteobacteria bacterium]
MIRGIHGLFFSSNPEATRRFFKNAVKLPGADIGEGWWIFDFAEGDMGVHPVDDPRQAGEHDVSFYCDDIHGTVADLKSRGVRFTKPVEDHGYGLVTYFKAPGGITVQLYEPHYQKGKASAGRRSAKKAQASKGGRAAAKPKKASRPAAAKSRASR